MSSVLKNILSFTGLVVDAPVSQAHGLNRSGITMAPRLIAANASGFTITADAANVTVTRTEEAGSAVAVYCELWHTYEDAEPLPGGIPEELFPFVIAGGGGGGGGGGGVELENDGAPLTGGPFTTLNLDGLTASDAGGGVANVVAVAGDPGVELENEGVPLAGGPFTTLNLSGLTATDGGGGVADVVAAGGGAVTTDSTLTGDGSGGDPLGVAIPLTLAGSGTRLNLKALTSPSNAANIQWQSAADASLITMGPDWSGDGGDSFFIYDPVVGRALLLANQEAGETSFIALGASSGGFEYDDSTTTLRLFVDAANYVFLDPTLLRVDAGFALSRALTPVTLTAETQYDDYNPTGWSDGYVMLRLSADGDGANLTGLVPVSTSGQIVMVTNIGAFDLIFYGSSSATPANTFLLPKNAPTMSVPTQGSFLARSTTAGWQIIGMAGCVLERDDDGIEVSAGDGEGVATVTITLRDANGNLPLLPVLCDVWAHDGSYTATDAPSIAADVGCTEVIRIEAGAPVMVRLWVDENPFSIEVNGSGAYYIAVAYAGLTGSGSGNLGGG